MPASTAPTLLLSLAWGAGLATASPRLAEGPNALVPPGAPLPAPQQAHADAACDDLGLCGAICPNPSSVFIADFAYDQASGRFAVLDVVTPDGIFWMDASGCSISGETSFAGVSQRGCAIDNDTGIIYAGGWNDDTIWRLDADFNVLGSQFVAEDIAGLAVSEETRMLYASTNSSPDMLIEFAIQADGSVVATGNRWTIPWQAFSDGYSTAALEYDDASGIFMAINQDANTMEYFDFDGERLTPHSYCALPVSFGWGFGLDFEGIELKVADIVAFACDFPIHGVEPDPDIVGSNPTGWNVRYSPLATVAVRSFVAPFIVTVRNNTGVAQTKSVWIEMRGRPVRTVGRYLFPAGDVTVYSSSPVPFPDGTHEAVVAVGDTPGGEPDATSSFTFTVASPGIQ